jgi:hypothetical protein
MQLDRRTIERSVMAIAARPPLYQRIHKEDNPMSNPAATPSTTDRELVITRLIDAPREKLFRAWTEPELLKQWFAPQPLTTTVEEIDVHPGGANRMVMRDPQARSIQSAACTSKSSKMSASSSPMLTPAPGSRRKTVHDRGSNLRG